MGPVRFLGSLWFGAVVLIVVLVAMACATVYESAHGTERALAVFYMSRWFQGLLALLGVSVLIALASRFSFSRAKIGFVLTHGSILLILMGAAITRWIGVEGQLALMEGESSGELRLSGVETVQFLSPAGEAVASMDLPPSLTARLVAVDKPAAEGVAVNGASVTVARYLPDSEARSQVLNDSPQPRLAVEVILTRGGIEESAWVFAGETSRIGDTSVALTTVQDDAELKRRLAAFQEAGSSIGKIKAKLADAEFDIPVETCLERAAPVGSTGYSVRVIEYLPHARVGGQGTVTNQSEQPVNPAVRVEISGPAGASTRLLFARFPEFGATHGVDSTGAPALTFVASDAPVASAAPIEILMSPGGAMIARFSPERAPPVSRAVRQGEPVETPWPGAQLTVRRFFDRARVVETLGPPEKPREQRTPAVLLTFDGADGAIEAWVQKHRPRRMRLGGALIDIQLVDRNLPLGFSVALNKFTVGYYPGGRRPRSFESQITITDPSSGLNSNRLVSMNHPTSYGGYTLYQSSYQLSGSKAMSVLSVSKDPGLPVVFAGYIGLMAGMVWVLVVRMRARVHVASNVEIRVADHCGGAATINLLQGRQSCLNEPASVTPTNPRSDAPSRANGWRQNRFPSEARQ